MKSHHIQPHPDNDRFAIEPPWDSIAWLLNQIDAEPLSEERLARNMAVVRAECGLESSDLDLDDLLIEDQDSCSGSGIFCLA